MSPKVATLGFVVLAIFSLVSCAPAGGSRAPARAKQAGPVKPLPEIACDELVSQAEIDGFMSGDAHSELSALRGAKVLPCRKGDGIGSGFDALVAMPSFRPSARTELVADVGGAYRADIELDMAKLAPELLGDLAHAFARRGRAAPRVSVGLPEFDDVLLGELPEVHHQIIATTPSAGEARTLLRFYLPASIAGEFDESLARFGRGETPLSFYTHADLQRATVRTGQALAGNWVRIAGFEEMEASRYLSGLWVRIQAIPGAVSDHAMPYLWMERARVWWPNLKLQLADGQREWASAWSLANGLWSAGPGGKTDALGGEASLKALRFLLTIDPKNSAVVYGAKLSTLETALGTGDDAALYRALVDLGVSGTYTPEQEAFALGLAKKLIPRMSDRTRAWSEALRLAKDCGFSSAIVARVLDVADWIMQTSGRDGFDDARAWVVEQGLDAAGVGRLKGAYGFFAKRLAPDDAFAKSVDLIVTRQLPKDASDAYLAIVAAIELAPEKTLAFAKADDYVFARRLDPDRLRALASTLKWMTSRQALRDIAVAKTEDYLLARKMKAADVLRIQRLWIWMQDTSRNLVALDKAEEWVIARRLTADQTLAIQKGYDWLAYTPKGAEAFAKAEAYVIDAGLTLEQVEQMRELDGWLCRSPVGAASVDKSEEYVIKRRLSKTATDLLSLAFYWLKTAPALDPAAALARAESYLLVKNLTPEKFRKLREAYDRAKKAGTPGALEQAETETFGAALHPHFT